MNKIDEWMKRLREMGTKPQERVRAFDRDVVMTRTQAHRFRELQDIGHPAEPARAEPLPDQDWYTLDEACQRLGCEPATLLEAAAAGRLACFVSTKGLRGHWNPDDGRGRVPAYLALTAASCRDIASYGSANVSELSTGPGDAARFELAEVQWIDGRRIALRHPLPEPGS